MEKTTTTLHAGGKTKTSTYMVRYESIYTRRYIRPYSTPPIIDCSIPRLSLLTSCKFAINATADVCRYKPRYSDTFEFVCLRAFVCSRAACLTFGIREICQRLISKPVLDSVRRLTNASQFITLLA